MVTIVIGAGLSGLVTAFTAKKKKHSVIVLEKSARAGGVIRSERDGDFLLEYGPNTVLLSSEIQELIHDLRLESELLVADPKSPRYVQFCGKLYEVPLSLSGLLRTSLLSPAGKLSLLKYPFTPRTTSHEENLYEYAQRRMGDEAAERLVSPFVSGIWAGDAKKLSALSVFPKKKHEKKRKGLFSFQNGMNVLTNTLAQNLASEIRLNTAVEQIERVGSRWNVMTKNETITADKLVLTLPAPETAHLIEKQFPSAAKALKEIPYAKLSVVHMGYRKNQTGKHWPGFGYLAAPADHSHLLGCLWSSNLFPGRAPEDSILCTAFVSEPTSVEKVNEALRPIMQITGTPAFSKITNIPQAIPQYTMGHAQRIAALEETEKNNPGIIFGGNYRGGISVGDVVRSSTERI